MTQNRETTSPIAANMDAAPSAIDIIAQRFEKKASTAETPLNAAATTIHNAAAPTRFIIAELPRLEPIKIVIVLDHSAAGEVKQKFAEHALWSAEELVFFMERFFAFHDTDNGPRWTLRVDLDPEANTENAIEHFIAVNRIKAATKGFLSRRT